MRKYFELGGLVAAVVLIVFGAVAITMGINGRHTVANSLQNEYIVGSPDMTPSAIKSEAQKAGIASKVTLWPTQSIANQKINTGAKARLMSEYMRIHTLEATQGYTYSQMGIWTAKPGTPKAQLMPGGGTDNSQFAAIDPKTQQPVQNAQRQIWVTYTGLATALNTSYMASQLALFGIVVGIALLLTGIGFAILAAVGALRNPETILAFARKPNVKKTPAVPVA